MLEEGLAGVETESVEGKEEVRFELRLCPEDRERSRHRKKEMSLFLIFVGMLLPFLFFQ